MCIRDRVRLADMVVFDDLESVRPEKVFVGGRLVVSNGRLATRIRKKTIPSWIKSTVKLKKLRPTDFAVPSKKDTVVANTIFMLTEIVTKLNTAELSVQNGGVCASADRDIWKVAAFDRTGRTVNRTMGFLEKFGAEVGAFASTWSLHENNLIVIGANDSDMAAAANHLVANQGGMSVAKDGKILASLPLPIAGIISDDSFEKTLSGFEGINSCIADSGCVFSRPHLIPLFLPFLAIPSVRILSGGIVNIKKRTLIPPIK